MRFLRHKKDKIANYQCLTSFVRVYPIDRLWQVHMYYVSPHFRTRDLIFSYLLFKSFSNSFGSNTTLGLIHIAHLEYLTVALTEQWNHPPVEEYREWTGTIFGVRQILVVASVHV